MVAATAEAENWWPRAFESRTRLPRPSVVCLSVEYPTKWKFVCRKARPRSLAFFFRSSSSLLIEEEKT